MNNFWSYKTEYKNLKKILSSVDKSLASEIFSLAMN